MGDFMRLSSRFTELTEQDVEQIGGGFFFKKFAFKKFRRCFRFKKRPCPPRPPVGPPGKDDHSLNNFSASFSGDYDSNDFFTSDFE